MKQQKLRHCKRDSKQWLWAPLLVALLTLLWAGCSSNTHIIAPTTTVNKTPTIALTPLPKTCSGDPCGRQAPLPKAINPLPNAARIDAYLTRLAAKGVLSGSVLVWHNGMLFEKGYSLANKDARIPNTTQTRFRIGSVTKQFTAMAILMLQEQGKLHVADPMCLYIPDCPQDWQPITIGQLLTHSSGIPDYVNFPDFVSTWTRPTTPEQLIARFKDLPLDFPPGSRFRYSNSGYVLLGYIIERVSGESYANFLQAHIFGPLKMYNTGYDTAYPPLPQHATGYYAGYIKPDPYDTSVLYAAGALYSTVEDLNVWDQALMQQKLVSSQALDAMFTLHVPCPPPGPGGCLLSTDQGYGYGWFIAAEPQGKLIYHVGYIDGFFAYNGFYPASNLVVVVLSNLETTNVLSIGRTLASIA